MIKNGVFRLSRIFADGWNAGSRFHTADGELTTAKITALNPHKNDPERARWLLGFHGAREAGKKEMRPDSVAAKKRASKSCLDDLLEVLCAHPEGLRRWSVMRAIRVRRMRAGHDIMPRFEDAVEREFRRHCTGDPVRERMSDVAPELFYRPKDTVGEVWAAYPYHHE